MTWIAQNSPGPAAVDLETLQESALAMAQATIQNAMDERGLKPSKLAASMGRKRPFVSRMLRGDYNMTIKTFALALAACGYRAKLSYGPLNWGWASEEPPKPIVAPAPASAGTPMRTGDVHIGVPAEDRETKRRHLNW